MSKAICENLMVEKAKYVPIAKFVTVRYGNVLNSRGSVLPLLQKIGLDPNVGHFNLTHYKMTRFIMTLADSVNLIEYAILSGRTGEMIIPKLLAMYIKNLMQIFSEK